MMIPNEQKLLTIAVSPGNIPALNAIINTEFRLNELVGIQESDGMLVIKENTIFVMPGWDNRQPPVLFPPTTFSANNLLGLIYARLSNYEKAYPLLEANPPLLRAVDLMNRLQHGIELPDIIPEDDHVSLHNYAIAVHYSMQEEKNEFTGLQSLYGKAMAVATDAELRAFTAKQFALLLSDAGMLAEAEILLTPLLKEPLSRPAIITVKALLGNIWLRQLTVPYDEGKLGQLKEYLWECLEYYEQQQQMIAAGMVLTDAAYIAGISDSHSEALGYINRAIAIFDREELPELLGDALMKKGSILHRWAQKGNPQFFQQAAKSYQSALKIFTRDNAPSLFADIHHQLGNIYADIPDEVKKKSVWAAVSASSFNEALSYYNKVDHPYQFAVICNSQANAFTKYPDALHSDNFDKALAWYREALDIQTAVGYPVERSLTLLNYLEASWYAGNKEEFDKARFNDMQEKAREVLVLNDDPSIVAMAREQLVRLAALKEAVEVSSRV